MTPTQIKKYECSSKGDKRFSAFCAKLEDGRSIEQWYQCDIKGYDVGGTDWKKGKGKPPLHSFTTEALFAAYCRLWWRYLRKNPLIFEDLKKILDNHELTDMFATGPINQAAALTWIMKNHPPFGV